MRAILALEDGTVFEGEGFGADRTVTGEICFNTSMTGYQEVLTDPSYRGQIITMTYPQIGNYGINELDAESDQVHVRALVVEELSVVASNWRSEEDLDSYLKRWNVPGLQGVDTRALTKHLRLKGAMRACVMVGDEATAEAALEMARNAQGVEGMDYVKEVTTSEAYEWDPDGTLSRQWTIVKGREEIRENVELGPNGQVFLPLPEAKYFIVAYDFGIKRNILRRLRQHGFRVRVVPATTSAKEVLDINPDGVFLGNGPGDPAALDYAHETARELIGKKPLFGICLGQQILGYAFGGKTFKMKFGHRGGNQPVQEVATGKVSITAQNHGFAIDPATLPSEVTVTHINLNDQTVAGIEHKEKKVFAVQYHPEAAPGPHDATDFFQQFANMIDQNRKN